MSRVFRVSERYAPSGISKFVQFRADPRADIRFKLYGFGSGSQIGRLKMKGLIVFRTSSELKR